MEKITSSSQLKEAIALLQIQKDEQARLLKLEFKSTVENLRPVNIIKNTFENIKDNLLGTTVGLTAGLVSKAVLVGTTHNPIKRMLGSLLQIGISNIVAKNPDGIKSTIGKVFNFFRKKKAESAVQAINEHNY